MEIIGLSETLASIVDAESNMSKMLEATVKKISSKLLKNVKLKSPVDTGQFRRSWRTKKRGQFEMLIYNNTEYGIYLEYGHRTKGGNKVIEGKYVLKRSIEEVQNELEEELKNILKSIW